MRADIVAALAQYLPHGVAETLAPTWFTCVGVAGLVTLAWLLVAARRHRLDQGAVASIVGSAYVAAVLAGIAIPAVIACAQALIEHGELRLRWAGMTSFWGCLGAFAAIVIGCRRSGIALAQFGDLAAAPLGIALVCARLGCFVAGCDYGKVSSAPWAVRFPAGASAWRDHVHAGLLPAERAASLPVHPTQLYEALLGVAITVVALLFARTRPRAGRVALVAIAMYAVGRIGIETLRGDLGRGIYLGLSSGQLFSLCVLLVLAGVWLRRVLVGVLLVQTAQAQPMDPYAPPPAHSHVQVGALLGVSAPLNRRADQVPALAGPSLSVGWANAYANVWVDLDSLGNEDATHTTLLLSGGSGARVHERLYIGGRVGIGATWVNFERDVFADVTGTTLRFEALAEWTLTPAWTVWLRPVTFDILSAADLGGPIVAYQMRIGAAYRFALGGGK